MATLSCGPLQCGDGGGLGDAGDAGGRVALHRHHRLHQILRAAGEPHPPPGHGIGLRHATDRQRAIPQRRLHRGHRRVLEPVEHQVLVHVVAHDPDMRMAQHHLAQRRHFGGRTSGAGWIVREVQDQPLGARRNGGVQILWPQLEAVILRTIHRHRHATHQLRRQRISAPIRGGDHDLVPVVDGGQQGVGRSPACPRKKP